MFRITIGKEAVYIAADPSEPKELHNLGGDAAFYKVAPDVDSGDTELAEGATAEITAGVYVLSTSKTELGVRALENVDVADDLTVSGKVTARGEVEVDGDLNHDGAKAGFFGVAPAARPEVKKEELTAGELALALEELGLVDVEA